MHISNDRYFRERSRHDLALRMIRHEARTCTIKACTLLTEDRIRRLCKTYEIHAGSSPVRRRRGKAPRQVAFFTRNLQLQFESACLASVFVAFELLHDAPRQLDSASIEYGVLFCAAFETHRQLSRTAALTFEHAWFMLQQLNVGRTLTLARCRECQGQFLRDVVNAAGSACPTCRLKKISTRSRRRRPQPADTLRHRHGRPALATQSPGGSVPQPPCRTSEGRNAPARSTG
jgi:Flagellar transcriptional activator (FlhC)